MATIAARERGSPFAVPRGIANTAWIVAFGVVVLVLWEAAVRLLNIPRIIVPAPSDISNSLIAGLILSPFAVNGYLYQGSFTLAEALLGFVAGSIIGLVLGVLLSQFRVIEDLFMPYIVGWQCLPRIALAPLIILWVGIGWESKLVLVVIISFFPVFVNSLSGFREVDPERIELMRGLAASRWTIFRLVQFPSALPMIFAGLDIALVFSLIGAVVGELLGSRVGLGQLLLQQLAIADTAGMFAVFIVLALFGIVLTQILQVIRKRVLFWAASERFTIGT